MSNQEKRQEDTSTLSATSSHWKTVLYNDEDHTYDYVVEMLSKVCQMSREQAFRCAVEVDITGRTAVFYGSKEACQEKAEKINAYGPDHRMPRSMKSMSAGIESR